MALLEMRHIYKSYGTARYFFARSAQPVLVDVSCEVAEKKSLGLIGKSGSGKSTLARIALGLEAPDAGTVRFMGKDLGNATALRETRRHLQIVFQDCLNSVNPGFTVESIIREPLRYFENFTYREEKRRIAELLQTVGLRPGDCNKFPHQLSGGELQRVCIARAVAAKPRLIVLDEALSSLDMMSQAHILQILLDLKENLNTAYLFITHDIRLVRQICDDVAVMDNGRIVDFSSTTQNPGYRESQFEPRIQFVTFCYSNEKKLNLTCHKL